jgi:hypothetical protein
MTRPAPTTITGLTIDPPPMCVLDIEQEQQVTVQAFPGGSPRTVSIRLEASRPGGVAAGIFISPELADEVATILTMAAEQARGARGGT